MRRVVIILCNLYICTSILAQAPPVLRFAKNFGGSSDEFAAEIKILPGGNLLVTGSSASNNGDVSGHHGAAGPSDVWIVELDPTGNTIIWQKSYGGSDVESLSEIIPTIDGGFIFVGIACSIDGDITGHHGTDGNPDIWVVKLDANGNIIWQKCYGGIYADTGSEIIETDDGYIITGQTNSKDGDVTGHHGANINDDIWVLKIDVSGNLIWQKCYGGSNSEGIASITRTLDGAFLITGVTESRDGNVSTPPASLSDIWVFKISSAGTIIWDKCFGGNSGEAIHKVIINSDGSFFMVGFSNSTDLPGAYTNPTAPNNALVMLLDASGNTIWIKAFGGTGNDAVNEVVKTPDGGYLLCGSSSSRDGIVCPKYLSAETWLVKMDGGGNIQWNRTYGGSRLEHGTSLVFIPSGDCFVLSSTYSNDGDITAAKGASDIWLTRFSFTGTLIYPSVTIRASKDSIGCAGNTVQFIAVPVDGGTAPSYQWKVNGRNVGSDNDTVLLNNIYESDLVSCVLTSNSNCVDIPTATSNNVKIKVSVPAPKDFLPGDTALCAYQRIELRSSKKFAGYLWSNGSTAEAITVKQPGLYWVDVVDNHQCIGTDSILITNKPCIEGIFVPTAFTPNKDGRNDVFRPTMNADVKQYRFIVYDRWGNVVFESTTLNQGWDGNVKNIIQDRPYNTGVFLWQCIYQLEGEASTSKRGTVLLLR